MSDFNSSLPVRTENAGDVIAKLADATTPSQQLAIDASGRITTKMDDGAGNAITSQVNGAQRALDVGINVSGVQIDPRSIRALTSADIVTVDQGTTPWVENLSQVGGSAIALGQTTMSASLPVTFASNQSALPVSQSGTWTVAVTQSTSPWITSDLSDGSSTGGTAGSKSSLSGGIYNTTLPTLTNGQQAGLQIDSSGRLLTDTLITFPYDENYGTVGATTLRTAAQLGNATGAADFNAGATGAQTLRTVANQGAPNTNTNAWFTRLTDGTNNVSVTATGELKVDVTQPLPAGTNSIGTVVVSNLPTTVDTNYGAVGASTLRTASEIGNATGAANFGNGVTGAQTLRVAANLAVAGADVTATNPIPVSITTSSPGTAIQNYQTSAALAAGSSATFTFTVPASHTFNLERVWTSASGKIKTVVQNGSSTIFVGFNSTSNPNIDMTIISPPTIAAAGTVNVVVTNDDKAAMDVYCTIEGNQN